MDMWTPSVAK